MAKPILTHLAMLLAGAAIAAAALVLHPCREPTPAGQPGGSASLPVTSAPGAGAAGASAGGAAAPTG
jgi:hypothetical protein